MTADNRALIDAITEAKRADGCSNGTVNRTLALIRANALKRSDIEDFRWHDLRHTWASWHAQGGTPLFALQELAGWETEKMVRRYAHLAAERLAVYAGNTESQGTNATQAPDFHGTARLQW
jgi:integrase